MDLTDVKMLDCSNNQLTGVPVSLSQMSSLEQLYLRHNKLSHLPNLRSPVLKVCLASAQILPGFLEHLYKPSRRLFLFVCAQDLYFGNNQIEQLEPEQLSSLTAISVLELRDNKIQSLPEQVTLLGTLTRLDLTNNDISRSVSHIHSFLPAGWGSKCSRV